MRQVGEKVREWLVRKLRVRQKVKECRALNGL